MGLTEEEEIELLTLKKKKHLSGTPRQGGDPKARGVTDDPAGAVTPLIDPNALSKQLTIDEGTEDKIYLDTKGLPTFGIGHLITKSDPEYGQPVGTAVSKERISSAFKTDMGGVEDDLRSLVPSIEEQPQEVRQILGNMAFNLGRERLGKFKKMLTAVSNKDYVTAAAEMKNSEWYGQVKDRGKRLVERMESIQTPTDPSDITAESPDSDKSSTP